MNKINLEFNQPSKKTIEEWERANINFKYSNLLYPSIFRR